MKCALIQLNPKVGDIRENARRILAALEGAAAKGARLAVLPELSLIGYPPRDLLLYPAFVREAEARAEELARKAGSLGIAAVVGTAGFNHGKGRPLRNLALVMEGGSIRHVYAKRLLPTYDVFDEARYFEAGEGPLTFALEGKRIAVTVCEDIWNDEAYWPSPLYRLDPLEGHPPFDVLVNLSASPFSVGKQNLREDMLAALAAKRRAFTLYVNQSGANDELIFDGRSSCFSPDGRLICRARGFAEDVALVDLDSPVRAVAEDDLSPESETWRALGLGVSDYCAKNGIGSAVLGLSGGIDSALTAAIAAASLGPENVHGLVMPSPYSSAHSVRDAEDLARNLRLGRLDRIPIAGAMGSFGEMLGPVFGDLPPDAAEENIQARIRGTLLMGVANKFGRMLLTTGNKSEISVGYCTIYGDMCGALAVIGDLYKTEVFRLARWLNRDGEVIPENTILKPPSAELRPGQTDQDSLPPYDLLDKILIELLELRRGPEELAASGLFDPDTVFRVARLVNAAEFKRRQAAPVLKITGQAFGVGWRMPIAARSVFFPCREALPADGKARANSGA
ncbi:MAG: NAD+ synthase [Deltaproteobacteria bacterium]|jgi:NAD+ synthase/NAD+ synthase (glutamine-hydrolysing)|nr:NAD+ synthase [Deltaproteobacteria bacterium]